MNPLNKLNGLDSERLVMKIFKENGFEVKYIDNYYDIEIKKNNITKKLEVKSCNLIIKNGGGVMRFGKFDFENQNNSKKKRTNNVDICFVVGIRGNYEIIGFLSSKIIKKHFGKTRYIPLKKIINLKLTRINKYMDKFVENGK